MVLYSAQRRPNSDNVREQGMLAARRRLWPVELRFQAGALILIEIGSRSDGVVLVVTFI